MKPFAIFFIFLVSTIVHAQKQIYLKGTAGNYWMHSMKEILIMHHQNFRNLGVVGTIEPNFSASSQWELGMDFTLHDQFLRKHLLGFFVGFAGHTYGKVFFEDSSRDWLYSYNMQRFIAGARGELAIGREFLLYGKAGIGFSNMFRTQKMIRNGSGINTGVRFFSRGISFEPGVEWKHSFKSLFVFGCFGYEMNFSGKIYGKNGGTLSDINGLPLRFDWSGFRLGAGVGFSLQPANND